MRKIKIKISQILILKLPELEPIKAYSLKPINTCIMFICKALQISYNIVFVHSNCLYTKNHIGLEEEAYWQDEVYHKLLLLVSLQPIYMHS